LASDTMPSARMSWPRMVCMSRAPSRGPRKQPTNASISDRFNASRASFCACEAGALIVVLSFGSCDSPTGSSMLSGASSSSSCIVSSYVASSTSSFRYRRCCASWYQSLHRVSYGVHV
jgi:hypothetical protein